MRPELSPQTGLLEDPLAAPSLAGEDGREPRSARRRARAAALGAILLVALAAAGVVMLGLPRAKQPGRTSAVPTGDTTAAVRRRTLTEHTQVSGTLGYGSTLELYDRISGTFTWLPSMGSVIERGGTLFKVNQLPIVLMYGAVPAYRTLEEGVSNGEDVAQLNENLVALGYDPYGAIADYEHFSEATAAAVRRWQRAEGLSQTGTVELGRVVFAPSARRVTAVHVALGQDPPGKEGAPAKEGSSDKEGAPGKEGSSDQEGSPGKKGSPHKERSPTNQATDGSPGKKAERKPPSGGSSKPPAAEEEPGAGGAGTLALSTTSTNELVQLNVEADEQQLARVGETVPVTLPSGQVVDGRITSVGAVAAESGGGEGGKGEGGGEKASIPVTVSLDRRVPHLDQAPVTVELVKAKARHALTVSATALIATAGGGYAIEALRDGRRVEMPVTPGMFADGYVQIEGEGVHAGLTVTEPAE